MQSSCLALYCHLWSVRLYLVFTHTLINGKNFEEKNIFEQNNLCLFSLQLMSDKFLIIRRIQQDIAINVHTCRS